MPLGKAEKSTVPAVAPEHINSAVKDKIFNCLFMLKVRPLSKNRDCRTETEQRTCRVSNRTDNREDHARRRGWDGQGYGYVRTARSSRECPDGEG